MDSISFKIHTIKTLLASTKPVLVTKRPIDDTFCLKLFDLLFGDKFSWGKKASRVALNLLLKSMPLVAEFQILKILKKMNTKEKVRAYREPESFFIYDYLDPSQHSGQYPGNKNFYLGLSFDIDNKIDYEKLPYLIDDLKKNNIRATINVITHGDYEFDRSFMKSLQSDGFEIGLHGDTHNSALAFLPKRHIRYKLQRAIDRLGFQPDGFRSPALSFSDKLIDVLAELGFFYDSSLTTGISMYKSIEFPYIFRYKGAKILEVPLFMQDYNYFVNDLWSEKSATSVFKKQIAAMSKIGGIALINLHPIIMEKKRFFWESLLVIIKQYANSAYTFPINKMLREERYRTYFNT